MPKYYREWKEKQFQPRKSDQNDQNFKVACGKVGVEEMLFHHKTHTKIITDSHFHSAGPSNVLEEAAIAAGFIYGHPISVTVPKKEMDGKELCIIDFWWIWWISTHRVTQLYLIGF